jgi:hypothetical protein
MGLCVCAHERGRYPSDQSSHEGDPLAVMRSPRPYWRRGRGSGVEFQRHVLDIPLPRGMPHGKAARTAKSRQGYKSYFFRGEPYSGKSIPLALIGLKKPPVPKLQASGTGNAPSAWNRQCDLPRHDPCVVLGHATIPPRPRLSFVGSGDAFSPRNTAIGRRAPALELRAVPAGCTKPPRKHEGIRVCKRKGSVQFPAYF